MVCVLFVLLDCCNAPIVGEEYSEPNYESLFYSSKNNTKICTRFVAGYSYDSKIIRRLFQLYVDSV